MSVAISSNFKINKRRNTISNEFESRMISLIKEQKKEEKILEEILDKKIPTSFNFFSKHLFCLMPRRCHSLINYRKVVDLSDYDNEKLEFDEWVEYNKEIIQKIEKEILKLLIGIYDKRAKLYPNNMCGLSSHAIKIKKFSNIFCSKFYELSIFILYIIHKQLNSFFMYIDDKINFKSLNLSNFENIKEILYHIGKDIKKIFQSAFDTTDNFKISSILIIKLEEYLIEHKKIEEKKTKNVPLFKEKEKFENFLGKLQTLKFQKDYEKIVNKKLCFEEENDDQEEKINGNPDFNNIKTHNLNNNNKNDIIFNNNMERKENENNKTVQNLNIDDLMSYINETKGKNNRKKKKKKKKGKKTCIVDEENESDESDKLEEDLIFIDYKKSLEKFSESIVNNRKITPKISDNFIKRLQAIND